MATGAAEAPKYWRVLLKLSGEALMGEQGFGIDQDTVSTIARQISRVRDQHVEVAPDRQLGRAELGRRGGDVDPAVPAQHLDQLTQPLGRIHDLILQGSCSCEHA